MILFARVKSIKKNFYKKKAKKKEEEKGKNKKLTWRLKRKVYLDNISCDTFNAPY